MQVVWRALTKWVQAKKTNLLRFLLEEIVLSNDRASFSEA